jgi:hypothetical protein
MIGVVPITTAQNAFSDESEVLKPATSCSAPKTRTLFALRAAELRGTFAHACENGAAASDADAVDAACDVEPAAAATSQHVTAAPVARSQRHLFIARASLSAAFSAQQLAGVSTRRTGRPETPLGRPGRTHNGGNVVLSRQ